MWLPKNRKGATILLEHYKQLADCIVSIIKSSSSYEVTLSELIEQVHTRLSGTIKFNLEWHLLNVKQDLEARGVIKTMVRPSRVQYIRMKRRGVETLQLINLNFAKCTEEEMETF